MNILSVFDGMSCGRIALDRIGAHVDNYFSSEIDKYAIQVANANWPQDTANRLGDVTKVRGEDLPPIDLLIGGSPCQGFSFAGKQLAFDDPRSALFFEFVRLLKECKPKFFLLENVRMKQEFQDVISNILGVEPIAINSRLLTYNQRKRIYWTNIPCGGPPEDRNLKTKDFIGGDSYGTIRVLKDKTRVVVESDEIHSLTARYTDLNGSSRPVIILDRGCIGEAFDSSKVGTSYRMLTPIECERLQTVPDNYTSCVSNPQRYKMLGNGWTVDVIAHILKPLSII